METGVNLLIGAAWAAILAVLLWGTATSWRRQLRNSGPLPMFRLLEREGVSVDKAEQAVGMSALVQAAGRCAVCPGAPRLRIRRGRRLARPAPAGLSQRSAFRPRARREVAPW